MKQSILICLILSWSIAVEGQSVGFGTQTPDPSAAIEVASTTQGMLVPRMTTTQREMISSPAVGLLVYDVTTQTFWFRDDMGWTELVAGYFTSSTALDVGQSEPVDTSTYKVQAWNTSAFDTHTLRASALCARLAN